MIDVFKTDVIDGVIMYHIRNNGGGMMLDTEDAIKLYMELHHFFRC